MFSFCWPARADVHPLPHDKIPSETKFAGFHCSCNKLYYLYYCILGALVSVLHLVPSMTGIFHGQSRRREQTLMPSMQRADSHIRLFPCNPPHEKKALLGSRHMQRNPEANAGLPLGEVQTAQEQLGRLLGGCLSLRSSCSWYHAQTPFSAQPLPNLSDSASLYEPRVLKQLFPSWAKAQVTKQMKKRRFLKRQGR